MKNDIMIQSSTYHSIRGIHTNLPSMYLNRNDIYLSAQVHYTAGKAALFVYASIGEYEHVTYQVYTDEIDIDPAALTDDELAGEIIGYIQDNEVMIENLKALIKFLEQEN